MRTFRFRTFATLLLACLLLAACATSASSPDPTVVPSPTLGLPTSSFNNGNTQAYDPPPVPATAGGTTAVLQEPLQPAATPDPAITKTAPAYEWVTTILMATDGQSQIEITPKTNFAELVYKDLRQTQSTQRQQNGFSGDIIAKGEAKRINDAAMVNEDGSVTYSSGAYWHFYARVFGQIGSTAGPEIWVIEPDNTAHAMSVTFVFDGRDHMEINVQVDGQEVDRQQAQLCPTNCELRFNLEPLRAALPPGEPGNQFYGQGLSQFYQFSFPADWHPSKTQ